MPNGQNSAQTDHPHQEWTNEDSLPSRGPRKEGDGGGLNRIGVLLGRREGRDVHNNPQLEKI